MKKYTIKNEEYEYQLILQNQEKNSDGIIIVIGTKQKEVTKTLDLLRLAADIPPPHGYGTVKEMDMDLKIMEKLEKLSSSSSSLVFSEDDMKHLKVKVESYRLTIASPGLRDWKKYWEDWKPTEEK